MITQFKIFESENQFREVDLQLLWDDITRNYYTKIFDKPMHLDYYFYSTLKKMLLGKNIEFNRVTNKWFDTEPFYNFNGKVEDVEFKDDSYNYLIKYIIILLDDGKKYNLKISNNYNFERKPVFVKIYDSEELEIEEKINLLKNTDKYNL
jgi:hypothetical protein